MVWYALFGPEPATLCTVSEGSHQRERSLDADVCVISSSMVNSSASFLLCVRTLSSARAVSVKPGRAVDEAYRIRV